LGKREEKLEKGGDLTEKRRKKQKICFKLKRNNNCKRDKNKCKGSLKDKCWHMMGGVRKNHLRREVGVVSTKTVLVEDCTWLHHRSRCGEGTWPRPGTPSSLALLSA
jgi:hypothetical protein